MTACPSEDALLALAQGLLSGEQATTQLAHLADCSACRAVVAAAAKELFGSTLDGGRSATPPLSSPLASGAHVGRYVILDVVGRGAMGVVYAAYDPELDRRVALKILRPDRRSGGDELLAQRLLREGQAMARLSHPNLVAIHDVGRIEGQLFLAMEYVEGQTLRAWLAAAPREVDDIVRAFADAARGLAAAHRAGIIHRDFKPDNVLVDREGRVRVTDFGLARREGLLGEEPSPLEQPTTPMSPSLTATGALVGTPAYMSPEQLERAALDARSDQFSLCVALWEALYGELPFPAQTLSELRALFAADSPRSPSRDRAVPARLRRALLRGLRRDAEARFPSMEALIAALETGSGWSAGRVAAIALLAVTVVATAGVVWRVRTATPPCRDGAARIAATWGADARTRLRRAFEATRSSYASTVLASIEAGLDAWTARWASAHDDACGATRVRGEQPVSLMQLRMVCLEDRRRDLEALVNELATVDAASLREAPFALGELRSIDDCANSRGLQAREPPLTDPKRAARAEAAKAKTSQVRAHNALGRFAQARDLAAEAIAAAREASAHAVLADALLAEGQALVSLGEKRALSSFEEATVEGLRGGDDEDAAWGLVGQLNILTQLEARIGEGLHRGRLAEALLARFGGNPPARASLFDQMGLAQLRAGELAEAARYARLAVAAEEARDPRSLSASQRRSNLAMVLAGQGRLEEALHMFEVNLRDHERAVGVEHPDTLVARHNVGGALVLLRRPKEAIPLLERVVAERTRVLGARHHLTATTLLTLAGAHLQAHLLDAADDEARQAMEILAAALSPDDPSLWEPLAVRGVVELERGRPARARPLLERSVSVVDKAGGSPIERAQARLALGRALVSTGGDRARARQLVTEARDALRDAASRFGGENGARADELDGWLREQGL